MMKRILSFLWCAMLLSVSPAWADGRATLLDDGWRFCYGSMSGAEQTDYDDGSWRTVCLPHDWSAESEAAEAAGGEHVGPFSKKSPSGRDTGWTLGGEGWYRKTFRLDERQVGGTVELMFEGVMNKAEVWVNGLLVGRNHYGYQPFTIDITRFCRKAGEPNVVAVRATNVGHNSRWYTGSGIYRHVWLISKPRLCLDDVEVASRRLENGQWEVGVTSIVKNGEEADRKAVLRVAVYDADGRLAAKGKTRCRLAAGDSVAVGIPIVLTRPLLWSPDSPRLYRAVVTMKAGRTADEVATRFGLRTLEFSAERGFLLNGVPTLLRGGCVHHDNGLLGAAAFNRAEDRKLSLLKAEGFNAVRCSHNLPSPHFLDACDSIGLMVIDEAFDQWMMAKNPDDYHNDFNQHYLQDIETMVRRDRRHPSVIMWSLGNEIPGRIEPEGLEAARQMRQKILSIDKSRPITAAICEWDIFRHRWSDYDAKAFESLDVGGYNYLYEKYEADHKTHPQRVMYGAESYPKRAAENWNLVERLPYVVGDFVWTAMDYLGEGGIGNAGPAGQGYGNNGYGWPWFGGWCGDIDLTGQKKPQSYYRDVVWRRKAITMAVEPPTKQATRISPWGWQLEEQRWTFDGYGKDELFTINVYSRAPKVRLYLNDRMVGEKPTSADTYWTSFLLPYTPGTLTAVELYGAREGESFTLKTTGEPVTIRLTADRTSIAADGQDLSYVTIELVDKDGEVVCDSKRKVSISLNGKGELLACGNASPTDQQSFRSDRPRLFRGRALAIVRSGHEAGESVLTVESEGLPTERVSIQVVE